MAFLPTGLLTFTSDFGTRDAYVAEVKGAILSVFPGARIVDGTHEVPPQDVRTGAFRLERVVSAFPPGTVHLAVVDPQVGTERRPVAVVHGDHVLVGPDNGLLSWAAKDGAAWYRIDRPDLARARPSLTFHGRDLFGPVAAALAGGRVEPQACGPRIDDPVILPFPCPTLGRASVRTEVLVTDRFGNLILAVRAAELPGATAAGTRVEVRVGHGVTRAVFGPYGRGDDLSIHEDSSGFVEIATPGGDASRALGARPGSPVELRWGR